MGIAIDTFSQTNNIRFKFPAVRHWPVHARKEMYLSVIIMIRIRNKSKNVQFVPWCTRRLYLKIQQLTYATFVRFTIYKTGSSVICCNEKSFAKH